MKKPCRCCLVVIALSACVGTTVGDWIDFPAAAAGPADAYETKPLEFVTDRGWHVSLQKATCTFARLFE